jgi:hypothetical protein
MKGVLRVGLLALAVNFPLGALAQQQNVIVFVPDGLRPSAVTPQTAPTFARIRSRGIDFRNSHSTASERLRPVSMDRPRWRPSRRPTTTWRRS